MSLLEFTFRALLVLGLIISIMVIAYLSNTRRISSWAVDIWAIIAVAIFMVFLGKEIDMSLPEIVGMTVFVVLLAIPIFLVTRRWRLKRLSRKDK